MARVGSRHEDKKLEEYWPIELDNAPSDWPTKAETQAQYVRIYKAYMMTYEKTYSTEKALAFCMRTYGVKERLVKSALSFTRALIAAMKEKEQAQDKS